GCDRRRSRVLLGRHGRALPRQLLPVHPTIHMGVSMRSITAAAAATVALAMAPTAGASTNGGACSVSATASFTPGLTLTSGPFSYTIAGTLANCQAGNAQPASDSPG